VATKDEDKVQRAAALYAAPQKGVILSRNERALPGGKLLNRRRLFVSSALLLQLFDRYIFDLMRWTDSVICGGDVIVFARVSRVTPSLHMRGFLISSRN
ncbi:hypothetical protein AVEN_100908-2-1, partial [Araneus ventricosus]